MKKNLLILTIKILGALASIYMSYIFAIFLLIILSTNNIHISLTIISYFLLPSLLFILIFSQKEKRKKLLKYLGIIFVLFLIGIFINIGINKYNESITINTNININCSEYLPFVSNTKIVKLDKKASLQLKDNLPRVDGAAAVFPVYSAFVNATYPNTVKLEDGIFEYNNTVQGYKLLAKKEIDIFFGAKPSDEQVEYAEYNNTKFKLTEIGKEAFVFFVHKDNPIDSLTTSEIKKIYSGEITNWKELGGKNEKIVAFQRNEGSGSQSMLKRFMEDTKVMEPPTNQRNDFMSGIINEVADYKNKTSSIGFSFRYYMEGIIKNPNVKMLKVDGVEPNIENIKNKKYPITTPLYAVTYEGNTNENVNKLLDWVLSKEGQEIIEKTGYVGVK